MSNISVPPRDYGKRIAVLCGVDKVPNGREEFPRIRGLLDEVDKFKKLLTDQLHPSLRFELYKDTIHVGDELTRQTLLRMLTDLQNYHNTECILLYLAGHGCKNPYSEEDDACFLTYDAWPLDSSPGLDLRSLRSLLTKLPARNNIVILDFCYSGAICTNNLGSLSIVSSSSHNQMADSGESSPSFTSNLINAIETATPSVDGYITWSQVLEFARSSHRRSSSVAQPQYNLGSIGDFKLDYRPSRPVDDNTCPYLGLDCFTEKTEHLLFGRDNILAILIEKLNNDNFVAVVGTSGSGKSSVVRAKLLPEVRRLGWRILSVITPGSDPLGKLTLVFEEILKQIGMSRKISIVSEYVRHNPGGIDPLLDLIPISKPFYLLIDQFEETFTQCTKKSDRDRFIDLLVQIASRADKRIAVVLTIRVDFLDSFLEYNELTQLMQNQAVYMPSLTQEGLVDAIARPAQELGYSLQPGLLNLILKEIGEDTQCLPLLQFAMKELWDSRDQVARQLTIDQYEKQGGVFGALNSHAESLYESLEEHEQICAKRICLRLIRTISELRATRNRRSKQQLIELARQGSDHQDVLSVLNAFMDARLLVTDDNGKLVDLAHEALMDRWERFLTWRNEEQSLLKILDRIEDYYSEWLLTKENLENQANSRENKPLIAGQD